MSLIETRLNEMGLTLPTVAAPAGSYVPWTIAGRTLYVSGQVPMLNGKPQFLGKVGREFDIEGGQKAAQLCALNILAQAKAALGGDLSRLKRCLKLGGFVNCVEGFADQPKVVNGASDLIVGAMGDAGRHARFAVGAPGLPLGVAVEVDAIFEIEP
jgi:enamine deaminase RidA (YjgF/YER057c/UK114 family)